MLLIAAEKNYSGDRGCAKKKIIEYIVLYKAGYIWFN